MDIYTLYVYKPFLLLKNSTAHGIVSQFSNTERFIKEVWPKASFSCLQRQFCESFLNHQNYRLLPFKAVSTSLLLWKCMQMQLHNWKEV